MTGDEGGLKQDQEKDGQERGGDGLLEAQRRVDAWISRFEEGYWPPLANLARLMEEVGELASAIAEGDQENKAEEFADVMAWLATLANVEGVDLTAALTNKYGTGCPGCGKLVCACSAKP